MPRYIDADEAVKRIKDYGKAAIDDGRRTLDPVDDIVSLAKGIDMIPAADVQEVVRCKDCRHWNNGDCYRLELSKPDDFCSYGERKEAE